MAMVITYWQKRIYRWSKCVAYFALCVATLIGPVAFTLLTFTPFAFAINQDQLWLPRDYYRHFRSLTKAAEMSEQTERCDHVIAGTLSQERSTKDHPVFIVTCRDQERQTFAYIIDGLSLEILNRPPPPDPEMVAEKELQLKLEQYWLACYQQIKRRTQGLRGTNLSQDLPAAEMQDEENMQFHVDFNATSMQGHALHFRAECIYESGKKSIDIHPRLTAEQGQDGAVIIEDTAAEL